MIDNHVHVSASTLTLCSSSAYYTLLIAADLLYKSVSVPRLATPFETIYTLNTLEKLNVVKLNQSESDSIDLT